MILLSTIRPFKGCFIFKKGLLAILVMVHKVKYVAGVYPMKSAVPSTLLGATALATSLGNSLPNLYDEWHQKSGSSLDDPSHHLSQWRSEVPYFARSAHKNINVFLVFT